MMGIDGWSTIPRPIWSFLTPLRSNTVGEPNAPADRITVFARTVKVSPGGILRPLGSAMAPASGIAGQISGNELIVVSAIAPSNWTNTVPNLQLLLAQPMLTDRAKTRVVLLCPVSNLLFVIPLLQSGGLTIEHIYDY
jgi:hypothetical protein